MSDGRDEYYMAVISNQSIAINKEIDERRAAQARVAALTRDVQDLCPIGGLDALATWQTEKAEYCEHISKLEAALAKCDPVYPSGLGWKCAVCGSVGSPDCGSVFMLMPEHHATDCLWRQAKEAEASNE